MMTGPIFNVLLDVVIFARLVLIKVGSNFCLKIEYLNFSEKRITFCNNIVIFFCLKKKTEHWDSIPVFLAP